MSILKRMLIPLFIAAVSLSATSLVRTAHAYYGVCSPLDGVPGLLQKAGLLQAGTCTTVVGPDGKAGMTCNAGSACTVGGKAGTCKNTARPGGRAACACVPTP